MTCTPRVGALRRFSAVLHTVSGRGFAPRIYLTGIRYAPIRTQSCVRLLLPFRLSPVRFYRPTLERRNVYSATAQKLPRCVFSPATASRSILNTVLSFSRFNTRLLIVPRPSHATASRHIPGGVGGEPAGQNREEKRRWLAVGTNEREHFHLVS